MAGHLHPGVAAIRGAIAATLSLPETAIENVGITLAHANGVAGIATVPDAAGRIFPGPTGIGALVNAFTLSDPYRSEVGRMKCQGRAFMARQRDNLPRDPAVDAFVNAGMGGGIEIS